MPLHTHTYTHTHASRHHKPGLVVWRNAGYHLWWLHWVCVFVCVRALPPLSAPSNTLSSSITSAVLTHWLLQPWGLGLTYSHRPLSPSLSVCQPAPHTPGMCARVCLWPIVCTRANSTHLHTRLFFGVDASIHTGMNVSFTFALMKVTTDPLPPTHWCSPISPTIHHNNSLSSGDRTSS